MHHGLLVAEPAVAAAYALLGQEDPLAAAAAVVAGYHAAFPLEEEEIRLLFALVSARLAVSVTTSAMRAKRAPGDPYVTVSEAPAWEALERLDRVHPRFAHYAFREACGLPPFPHGPAVVSWLEQARAAPVLDVDPSVVPCLVLDLGVGSPFLGADPRHVETGPLTERIFGEMKRAGVAVAVGRYDEARAIYLSGPFASGGRATDERRTVHLGIDLFVEPGSTVRAPLPGLVHVLANNALPQDYGPLVILRHETGDGTPFYTLYGHLTEDTLAGLAVGQRVEAGQALARVGAPPTNGDWPPHLHFQLILDLLDPGRRLPRRRPPRPAVASGRASRPTRTCSSASRRSASRPQSPPPRRRWPRGAASSAATSPCPTGARSRSSAASGRTSTTSRDARTSTPTTTCRSSATRTRGSSARRRSSSASSTPTRATCTTRSCATPSA